MNKRIIKNYYKAWQLRQQGKTLNEIGVIMTLSQERVRQLIWWINWKKTKKPYKK